LAQGRQEVTAREPVVVVRLYDIGVGVRYIPELAPNQLPNAVKVLDTINLRTDRGDKVWYRNIKIRRLGGE